MGGRCNIKGALGLLAAVLAAFARAGVAEEDLGQLTRDPRSILADFKENASRDKTPMRAVPAAKKTLTALRLWDFHRPDAKFASYCDVDDWFYSNFVNANGYMEYPYTALYYNVSDVTKRYTAMRLRSIGRGFLWRRKCRRNR